MSTEYYEKNKEGIQKKARERCKNLSEEKKVKIWLYNRGNECC